jgi:putative tributyrin esterase
VAIISCSLHPAKLGISTTIQIILPSAAKKKTKFPVLWLLHDEGKNARSFLYDCSLQRLAEERRVLIVAPDLQNSLGCNMKPTPAWETYLTRSLTAYIFEHFPASSQRSQNFIAGVGTGGYAAFRLALIYPELYCAAAGINSQVDLPQRYAAGKIKPQRLRKLSWCFGESREAVVGGQADCFYLAKKLAESGASTPDIFVYCSEKDRFYRANREFCTYLKRVGFPFCLTECINSSLEEQLEHTLCKVLY